MTNVSSGSSKAWLIISCAWAFYLYEYIIRVSPSVMVNSLMHDFDVTSTSLGVLVSLYYLSYVSLQIPCGIIVDKLGPRKVVSFSALLCVIGCIIFANSTHLIYAQLGRFLMGAGSACAYLSTMKLTVEWMPKEKFALIASLTMFMGTIGGICGASPFAILVSNFGWRGSTIIAAIVGFFVMLLCYTVIRDKPDVSIDHEPFQESSTHFLDDLKNILKNKQNWLIGVYGCMMYLPLSVFAELWGVPYIMELYKVPADYASIASVLVLVGMGIGSILSSYISDYLKSYKKVMFFSGVGTVICFSLVFYVNLPIQVIFPLMFVGGLISGGQILYFAAAKEINPHKISGTVVGFVNCCVMASGLLFTPLLGKLLDVTWRGSFNIDNTRHYDITSYRLSFSVLIVGWLVSIVLSKFFIKETYPRSGTHEDIY